MAEAPPTLPRLDKMFLIGIWVETVLYGMNILIYGSAMFVLARRQANATAGTSRILMIVSTIAFMLSTAYVAVSLRQLLEAFIFAPPGKATLYFADVSARLPQSKLGIYTVNVCLQDLVLIWRLWIVFGRRYAVVIAPLILEAVRLTSSIVAMWRGGQPGVPIFDPLVHKMGIVDWTFDLVLNVGVTALIAGRLWWMGRSLASYSSSKPGNFSNKYTGAILTMVESGLLFAIATLVTVSLYLSGSIATVVAIDTIVQLATITPILIVVRVGFGLAHGRSLASQTGGTTIVGSAANAPMTFARPVHINVTKTAEGDIDEYALQSIESGQRKYIS